MLDFENQSKPNSAQKDHSLVLGLQQLGSIFSHYFVLNQDGEIIQADPSLTAMLGGNLPQDFRNSFNVLDESGLKAMHFWQLVLLAGKPVFLQLIPEKLGINLEGHFISAAEGHELVFLGGQKKGEITTDFKEQKYRSILANMNLGILEVDLEDKILYANQSFCDMSGYEEAELLGKNAGQFLLSGNSSRLIRSKSRLRKAGISDAYEIEVNDRKGAGRFWLVSGAPNYNTKGILIGSIGIHLDITDQKNLESELISAREMAEASARVKEDFLMNMSHEIRTPMHVITGMSELLGKTRLEEQQRFYLGNIRHAADNMLALMNDILDLSKMEAGKLNLENIPFEVRKVLQRMENVMQHKAEEKGLDLLLDIDSEGIAPVLMGDSHRLNQILYNLISNAIKFTERGEIRVTCRLEKELGQLQVLEFAVADTGVGMDKSFLGSLFEKFSQEHQSTSRTAGGTGLGMNICKELLDLMGGEIEVKSEKGQGTTVIFRIPFLKGTAAIPSMGRQWGEESAVFKGLRVLLVDDNELNRLVASTLLENLGAIIEEAENGKEAVEKFMRQTPDMVLMDIRMAVMDGLEASREIRRQAGNTVPIIALTAHAMKSEIDKFMEAGMNAYLPKPFREEQLFSVVSACLAGRSSPAIESESEPITSNAALWDLEKLKELCRGNEEFLQKMLRLFLEQTPLRIKDMHEAFAAKNWQAVSDTAHKMKPSLDNMGIHSLRETVRNLEKAKEFTPEKNQENLVYFQIILEKVLEDLKGSLK